MLLLKSYPKWQTQNTRRKIQDLHTGRHVGLIAIKAALDKREAEVANAEVVARKAREALDYDRRAFDQVWKLANPPAGVSAPSIAPRLETLKEAVEEACRHLDMVSVTFSSVDVTNHLKARTDRLAFDLEKNRANISSYMTNEMVEAGVLRIVEPSSGRRAATFKLLREVKED